MRLTQGTIVALFGVALPAVAQYSGPAILIRGEAPSAMSQPQIAFRPFVSFNAGYGTGLEGVGVTAAGTLPVYDSWATSVAWGVSGTHSWRRTKVGLNYNGSMHHYFSLSRFDSINHSLMLGITHQFTRHVALTIAQTGGVFSRDAGLRGLQETVPFDPSTSYIPTQDYFDNRTLHLGTQAHLTLQRSARLSFSLGGGFSYITYRSKALIGSKVYNASGDVQYRVTRRVTLGTAYTYGHFAYERVFGGAYFHQGVGSFAFALTPTLEISGYGGVSRLDSTFTRIVPLDPAIVALLGIQSGTEVVHSVTYMPNYALRLSRTFRTGVLSASVGRSLLPGNGLFLTSSSTIAMLGYTYTGLRRWSMGTYAHYASSKAVGDLAGNYQTTSTGFSVSRKITGSLHLITLGSVRRYDSKSFARYNRTVSDFRVGIGFTPGDIPLRVW